MNKFCIRDSEDPNQLASRESANQGLFCLPLCHEIGIVYTNWRSFYSFSIGKEPILGPASGLRNSNIVIIGQLRKYGISYFLKQEVHEREPLVCILPQYTSLDSILPKRNTSVVPGGSEVEKKKYMYRAVKQNPNSKTGFLVVSINLKKKL